MTQDLIFGFPIPVVLAFSVLVAILLALARVLASMRRPGRLRHPHGPAHGDVDAFRDGDETMFRLDRLEITPLAGHGRRHR